MVVVAEQHSLHRNSIAWQKGMELAKLIYQATQKFPGEERFGITDQLRRAAVSIPSNIAEGKGRLTTGELIQFLAIARGSTLEVLTQLELALMLGFGEAERIGQAQALAGEELKMLNATIATLRAKDVVRKQR